VILRHRVLSVGVLTLAGLWVVVRLPINDLVHALDIAVVAAHHIVVRLHSARLLVRRARLAGSRSDEVAVGVGQAGHAGGGEESECELHLEGVLVVLLKCWSLIKLSASALERTT